MKNKKNNKERIKKHINKPKIDLMLPDTKVRAASGLKTLNAL